MNEAFRRLLFFYDIDQKLKPFKYVNMIKSNLINKFNRIKILLFYKTQAIINVFQEV